MSARFRNLALVNFLERRNFRSKESREGGGGKKASPLLVVAVALRGLVGPVELQQELAAPDLGVGDAAGARDRGSGGGRRLPSGALARASGSSAADDLPDGAVGPRALVRVLLPLSIEPGRELRVGGGLGDLVGDDRSLRKI